MTAFLFHCYLKFCPYLSLGLICIYLAAWSDEETLLESRTDYELEDLDAESVPRGFCQAQQLETLHWQLPLRYHDHSPAQTGNKAQTSAAMAVYIQAAKPDPALTVNSQLQNEVPPRHY